MSYMADKKMRAAIENAENAGVCTGEIAITVVKFFYFLYNINAFCWIASCKEKYTMKVEDFCPTDYEKARMSYMADKKMRAAHPAMAAMTPYPLGIRRNFQSEDRS